MKINKLIYMAVLASLGLGAASCDDFLDRPAEDSYTTSEYYQTDQECYNGVNYLYNVIWSDICQPLLHCTETPAGNNYESPSGDYGQFALFSVASTNGALKTMTEGYWKAVANINIVYNNIKSSPASETAKNATMGECLTWKAFAYFHLVRMFGPIPIVHDTSEDIGNKSYNTKYRVETADVYEYIIMTLEKAMELLPKSADAGRIDYYSAEGLLAKVYLAKSGLGQSGTRNADDLAKAAELAKDVIDNSGRTLMENYEDIFRASNNKCSESLMAWEWYGSYNPWGVGNQLQPEIAMSGFTDYLTWGDWTGPSIDLQEAFGINITTKPSSQPAVDSRRKATMMLPGDTYSYFWRDKGGFDYLRFLYDTDYYESANGLQSGTGSNCVKHIVGNTADHEAELGYKDMKQATGLATHVLRLADVYLIYAEAVIGNNGSTTDASAIDAYYAVRHRAIKSATRPSSITFDDVWKERRLELAYENDRWFDYVRLSYYDADRAISELSSMKRSYYNGLGDVYETYYTSGQWSVDPSTCYYDTNPPTIHITKDSFSWPMPNDDVVFNPNLAEDPIHVDVREEYKY
jgi:hypothetical protein